MTTVIAINAQNDIYMDITNNLAVVTGQAAVEQAAQTATLAQLNEMCLFTILGMPSFQAIWIGTPQYALYQAAAIAAIQAINGVVSVNSFEISSSDGVMSYQATIESIYGNLSLSGNLNNG